MDVVVGDEGEVGGGVGIGIQVWVGVKTRRLEKGGRGEVRPVSHHRSLPSSLP